MRENNKKKRAKTVIRPPSDKTRESLSMDEVRSRDNKRKNKRRKFRRKLAALFAGLVVLCIGVVLIFSLCFKINTVSVKGTVIYSDKMIVDNCGVKTGNNLFAVNEEKISSTLSKSLPYIKSATIERKLPDELIINVKPTEEIAAVANGGFYVLIDADGKVLKADASIIKESIAIIENVKPKDVKEGEKLVLGKEEQTEAVSDILGAIGKAKLKGITKIDISNLSDILLEYEGRITIEAGSFTNIDTKLARATAALEREKEINPYSVGVLDLKTDPYAFFSSGKPEEETTEPVSGEAGEGSTEKGEEKTSENTTVTEKQQ